jgi:dTDP-4-amino-4,6-dideoxygalactose transaminase
MDVPFVDLTVRFAHSRAALHAALDRVIDHGQVILGTEVEALEQAIAAVAGCRHAVAVANGTDALMLSLRARGIGAGDEVITTTMSYLASTSSIALVGATPVFADVGDDLNLDPAAVERLITAKTRAIQLVHLAGIPAQVDEFVDIARRHDLVLIEDCAQAFGATVDGRMVGSFGDFGAVSLHPLKNLPALGDAGMILTDDDAAGHWLRIARNHGHSGRDECEFWSINSRLDALQAAFLGRMLADLPAFLDQRRQQAARYRAGLGDCVGFPTVAAAASPTFNMFMVLADRREALHDYLAEQGIETRIHYPLPIHRMKAARGIAHGALPRAEAYTERILSLPLGMHITAEQIDFVTDRIVHFHAR